MSEENDKIRYAQLKELVAGSHKTGNSVRDALIVSDATRHLANLIRKRPNINFEPEEEDKPKVKKSGK